MSLWQNVRGSTATLVALCLPALLVAMAFVVDVGHLYVIKAGVQASADAAALAGAQDINCCTSAPGTAIVTASAYSAAAGGRNVIPHQSVTLVPGFPVLKCLNSTQVSCTGPDSANAIVVKETASVPMFFARFIGVGHVPVTATATASAAGGQAQQLDVMLVLDTTASMNTSDNSCSISGATRLTCAMAGARTLLSGLAPSIDQVGLMIFPGLTNAAQVQYETDCSSTPQPAIAAYKASPVYGIVGLGSDFRTSDKATTLSTGSNMVKAVGGGGSSCNQGMAAIGGVGTFYADAVAQAQAALTANGRPNIQKVIIFLGDGDANADSSNMPSGEAVNQCHEAIAAAQAATNAGTWVYTIAYGASTSATGSCSTDSPVRISACSTLQQMASAPNKFYSDNVGGSSNCTSSAQSTSELVSIFQHITTSLGSPSLIPDNTT